MVRWRMLKVKSPPPRFPLSPIPWAPSAEQPTHSITYLVNHFYRLIGNTIGCKAGAFDYKQLKVRCCKTCQAIGRTARIKCWVKKKEVFNSASVPRCRRRRRRRRRCDAETEIPSGQGRQKLFCRRQTLLEG